MTFYGITNDNNTCNSLYTLQFYSLQMWSSVTVCHNLLIYLAFSIKGLKCKFGHVTGVPGVTNLGDQDYWLR